MRNRKRDQKGKPNVTKCTLNQVLRPEYREEFSNYIRDYCLIATTISVLGSLFFLFKCNRAFDIEDHGFFYEDGNKHIRECFTSILSKSQHTLPPMFKDIIMRAVPNFLWPELKGLGNAFNSLIDQYTMNTRNNIKKWSYSRIKTFFKLKRFQLNSIGHRISEMDVKNATKTVMFLNVATLSENVKLLLQEAVLIGIPVGENLCNIVRDEKEWFKTIPLFINIQRQIFKHHERYEMLNNAWRQYLRNPVVNAKPTVPRPPLIKNFRVIPLHDFRMKHIRIDIHLFYQIACKLGVLKKAKGFFGQPINITKKTYDLNPSEHWNEIFDLSKITKIGGNRTFDFAIVTDSVGVSLCFMKPERASTEPTNEQIKDDYVNKKFTFVLGIDPGVRTWNATVRKHIESGTEV